MPKFNDIDLGKWRNSEVWTDSLWIIPERDKSGKHSNFYHGNFVPQLPHQLILRYTKAGETVFDPFTGSGTTAFEAESLGRNFLGIEINPQLTQYITSKLPSNSEKYKVITGDSTKKITFDEVNNVLEKQQKTSVDLAILHPPYADIIKFSNLSGDLSNAKSLKEFLNKFKLVLENTVEILAPNRYLAIVIGDKYTAGQWIPLSFYCMHEAQTLGLTLKSIIVKNMAGNRAKQNKEAIWRFRALASDYYIFKHEYIFVFKKS